MGKRYDVGSLEPESRSSTGFDTEAFDKGEHAGWQERS